MRRLTSLVFLFAITLPLKSVWADDQDVLVGRGTKIQLAKPIDLGTGEHKTVLGPCTVSLMLWGAEVPKDTDVTLAPGTLTVQGLDTNGKWILLYGAAETIKVNCNKTTVGNIKTAFADLIESMEVVPADVPAVTLEVGPKS
jgi:hypothetical protein